MLDVAILVVLALATWRLADLFSDVQQDGPFDILAKFRHLAGVRWNEYNQATPETNFAKGLLCIYCLSTWIGTGYTILYFLHKPLAFTLALPFALSAVAVLIEERRGKDVP